MHPPNMLPDIAALCKRQCFLFEQRHLVVVTEVDAIVEVVKNLVVGVCGILQLLFEFLDLCFEIFYLAVVVASFLKEFFLKASDFLVFALLDFLKLLDFGYEFLGLSELFVGLVKLLACLVEAAV